MKFWKENQSLMWRHHYETVCITPWGQNALRIRATKFPNFTANDWALEESIPDTSADVSIKFDSIENRETVNASITNGRLCVKVDSVGIMTFYRDEQKILKEYHRDYDQPTCRESRCLKIRGREWEAKATKQLDYWITVDDNPAKILENYTEVTGRTPMINKELLGLWQCKLRYRTQDKVLGIARKYKELGILLDVIVIDFFHWTRQLLGLWNGVVEVYSLDILMNFGVMARKRLIL